MTEYGRRRAILLSNFCITLVTLPYFFTKSFWVLTITRFIYAFFSAVIVNASSLYLSETIPAEAQSKVGISINLGIVLGIFITQLFGLALPEKTDKEACENDHLWRVSFSLQLIPVVITTGMWLFLHKTEPLLFLLKKAEKAGSDSSAYKEARNVIMTNYNVTDEHE